jgi:twitching motility protein PilT
MRDLDTISVALTAAETGHMILSSLHTGSTTLAIDRMIDVFPAEQQGQIRQQLALSLHGIISQQLLPRKSGSGRVAAAEVLIANDAVRHHIRKQKLQNLHSEITLGKRIGMVTMEESLASLVRGGVIDIDEARARANRLDELETMLRGM